ncbi:family 43 glycosylhydrolase [Streptomyces xiamenensis]
MSHHAPSYTNPLIRQRADPHITRRPDGRYWFTATVPAYDRIVLRHADTLQGLSTAREHTVWKRHAGGEMSSHIWAPELHYIDGAWYLYFAAGRAEDPWAIRMYVLRNASPDPLTGVWSELGQLRTPWDSFSLDATTFEHRGTRYLAWAQHHPQRENNTSLFLAAMDTPWSVTGAPLEVSHPELDWETVGFKVNEGPAVLIRNGRVFLAYSAAATDANYCVGLLTADADSDLLDAASWTKSPVPVFRSSEQTGQYGPGHNSFTVAEDGTTDILVHHARGYRDITGDPLEDPNRHTRIQPLGWHPDGTPDFGVPAADGPTDPLPVTGASTGFRYTLTGFTQHGEASLFTAESADALHYEPLPGPGYVPPAGLLRDPSLLRHTDGYYYLVYTTGWEGDTIGFARSADRLRWSHLRDHRLRVPGLARTWAPEFFRDEDGSIHVIVSLDTTGDHRFTPHVLTATGGSLTSWTEPQPMAGLDGSNYIDTCVIRVDGTYHAITKQETTKYLEHATAPSLRGPYTVKGTGDWAGWGSWVEGPSLVPLDGGGWRLYYDAYRDGAYRYSDTHDGLRTWSTPRELPGLSGTVRHFSVLREEI